MGRLVGEPEEDTMVPLGHEGNGRQGRRYDQTGKVEGEPEEVTPVAGQAEPVGLVVVQTGFHVGFSFLEPLILLLAAAAVVAAAAGRGVRLVRV